MANSEFQNGIVGAWKLIYFKDLAKNKVLNYNDILIFSSRYYSDFQILRGEEPEINSHVGMYKMTSESITFQIQLSNHEDTIGRVASGTYQLKDDELRITFSHGAKPGTWVFKRLD